MKKRLGQYIGVILGSLTFIALTLSPLASQADSYCAGYYQHLQVLKEPGRQVPMALLLPVGVLLIVLFCSLVLARIERGKKAVLLLFYVFLIVCCSPVLAVWGVIWCPFILICTLLWGAVCITVCGGRKSALYNPIL